MTKTERIARLESLLLQAASHLPDSKHADESWKWGWDELSDHAQEAVASLRCTIAETLEPTSPPPPLSPIELRISIGAETKNDVIHLLENRIREWWSEEIVESHWGGAGTHGHIEIEYRDVTPEQYRAELAEWCEAKK
jgi:hypothetical protein